MALDVDLAQIWSDAEAQLEAARREERGCFTGLRFAVSDAFAQRMENCTTVTLSDGRAHVCLGARCPHLFVNADRQFACGLSGAIIGSETVREADTWMARATNSSNPDDNACIGPAVWRRRRDHFNASAQAWSSASRITAEDVPDSEARADARRSCKRGAVCVDQAPEPRLRKRMRAYRVDIDTQEAADRLMNEALVVIERIFFKDSSKQVPAALQMDARLQNPSFVLMLAIRKFVDDAAVRGGRMDLCALHDICVHAHAFAKAQREEQLAAERSSKTCGFNGRVRHMVANLVVSLWRAACSTPYMQARRGAARRALVCALALDYRAAL